MTRMKLLFAAAAVVVAALVCAPAANAAPTVHYIGAGSSAMWQGFSIAAVNDIAANTATCGGSANVGTNCTIHHWDIKTSNCGTCAWLYDSRNNSIEVEYGNLWVVWVDDTSGNPTDIWAYLSVDSTVGVRAFMANPRNKLQLSAAITSTMTGGAIANNLYDFGDAGGTSCNATPCADDANLPSAVALALNGATITAGMTDIRPEDAKYATARSLGHPVNPIYTYELAYNTANANIGTGILSGTGSNYGVTSATPINFSLPGGHDPFSGNLVSTSIAVVPIGESPILFLVNRSNSTGLGSIINSNTTITPHFTSDGSYYVRNVWTQHPFPPQANVFPNTNPPSSSYCSANPLAGVCKSARRPLGNFSSGGDCEGDNAAFTWPLNAALQGGRMLNNAPLGTTSFPIIIGLREPLSGTYNTTEYTTIHRFGSPEGNNTDVPNPTGSYSLRPPYISQEYNVSTNPLNQQCNAKYVWTGHEPADMTEGYRFRGIGTGEVTNGAGGALCSPSSSPVCFNGVLNTTDSIAYTFFSFGNVSKMATQVSGGVAVYQPHYGYLMVDSVDPLFNSYSGGDPGQPATAQPGVPTAWGELPNCSEASGSPLPQCRRNAIWTSGNYYPHLVDGTYPAWSELRLICDTTDPNCTDTNNGAYGLVEHLQQDIHNSVLGGVPDLLPFDHAGAWNPPFGDAGFIRQHFNFLADSGTGCTAGPSSVCEYPIPSTQHNTTHQSQVLVDFSTEPCSTAVASGLTPGIPASGPIPFNECGGDVGGLVIPVATAANSVTLNITGATQSGGPLPTAYTTTYTYSGAANQVSAGQAVTIMGIPATGCAAYNPNTCWNGQFTVVSTTANTFTVNNSGPASPGSTSNTGYAATNTGTLQ